MIIADFFSELALLDRATHYRSQEGRKNDQSPPGPLSKIIDRDMCPRCGKTIYIKTDTGINATFVRMHDACTLQYLLEKYGD